MALKGAEALLKKMLDLPTSEDALLPVHPVRILSDESSNVLILQGPASGVHRLERAIVLLDHPLAQIRSEAHFFETNETDTLRLGIECSSRDIAADGTLSLTDGGGFGPQETSLGMRIGASLAVSAKPGPGAVATGDCDREKHRACS